MSLITDTAITDTAPKPHTILMVDLDAFCDAQARQSTSDDDLQACDYSKALRSSAYTPPEVWQARHPTTAQCAAGLPATAKISAEQQDIWAFAATLYELCTGRPLVSNAYDRVDEVGAAQLHNWTGLPSTSRRTLQQPKDAGGQGHLASVPLLDLLDWCFDMDAASRPESMEKVLTHAFFDPDKGALREHIAVAEIRRLLQVEVAAQASNITCQTPRLFFEMAPTIVVLGCGCIQACLARAGYKICLHPMVKINKM